MILSGPSMIHNTFSPKQALLDNFDLPKLNRQEAVIENLTFPPKKNSPFLAENFPETLQSNMSSPPSVDGPSWPLPQIQWGNTVKGKVALGRQYLKAVNHEGAKFEAIC